MTAEKPRVALLVAEELRRADVLERITATIGNHAEATIVLDTASALLGAGRLQPPTPEQAEMLLEELRVPTRAPKLSFSQRLEQRLRKTRVRR